ncbi:MAG: TAXI family TRAP transporter solute-binding subunit, partial [Candidatus Riflebacteria bacterium]|nr:TAXI family TRAP transporter solute-binding subunit [Candidatus Riflebacteria bacterium]
MNKSINYILAFFIVICSSLTLYAQEEKYQIGLIKKIYSMGTASVNGTYYPLGNAISRLIGKKLKNMVVIAEPTPGSMANVEYLRKKRIDLALMQSDVAWIAHEGTFKDLRVLASLYSEKIQIVVRADSKIFELKDLKGKKIAIGEKESGSAAGATDILNNAGLKNGSDYEIIYERFTKSTDSLCDGYVDAIYYVGAVPPDGLIRLSNRVPIRLIEIPPEIVHKLTTMYPYYSAEKIGAEAYKGQTREI